MQIQHVRLRDVRRFEAVDFHPRPGFNLVTGANGSGKTSLLEAIHLLAHARSFPAACAMASSAKANHRWTCSPNGGTAQIPRIGPG